MKVAVLSDLHLGDKGSKLADGADSPSYKELMSAVTSRAGNEPLDYLVLAGDILDFSIASFEDACKAARPFFRALQKDALTRHIVYLPGNHDKHIWDAVEWEVNVIRRMKRHQDPRPFRRSQPACIDMVEERFLLPGIGEDEEEHRWGTLFLEGLFEQGKVIPIFFAYPNLYIRTPRDIFLVTHGHMLETAWVLLSEVFSEVDGLNELKPLSLGHLEELNVPLTAMICTGVGQAGELSKVCYEVEQEAGERRTGRLREVLDKGIRGLSDLLEMSLVKKCFLTGILNCAKRALLRMVSKRYKGSRFNQEFFLKDAVRKRFARFYSASCAQACRDFTMEPPRKVIFGHTHVAHAETDPPLRIDRQHDTLPDLPVESVTLYNTGGWLRNDEEHRSLVFFLDETGRLESRSIS